MHEMTSKYLMTISENTYYNTKTISASRNGRTTLLGIIYNSLYPDKLTVGGKTFELSSQNNVVHKRAILSEKSRWCEGLTDRV